MGAERPPATTPSHAYGTMTRQSRLRKCPLEHMWPVRGGGRPSLTCKDGESSYLRIAKGDALENR